MAGVFSQRVIDSAATDYTTWMSPLSWLKNASKPAIIFAHGGGGFDYNTIDPSHLAPRTGALAGYPVVSNNFGGTDAWGNDAAITKVGQAKTFALGSTVGARTSPDKVFLMSFSMGALSVCNWARANPTKVLGMCLFMPAVDLQYHHDNNTAGVATAGIDAAYTDHAGYLAARPTHSPIEYTATISSIPTHVQYASDDPVVIPAAVTPFCTAMGITPVVVTGGHSMDGINVAALVSFLNANA